MNSKFPGLGIFILILILTFSGCVSSPAPPGMVSTGSTDEDTPDYVNMDDALAIMNHGDGLGMAYIPHTIHSVIGRDVSPGGKAKVWIFAVKSDTMFYFTYNNGNYFTMNWSEVDPDPAINLHKILTPADLFIKHHDLVNEFYSGKNKGINEMELRNGRYYLRGYQENIPWEYVFDAVDGRRLT